MGQHSKIFLNMRLETAEQHELRTMPEMFGQVRQGAIASNGANRVWAEKNKWQEEMIEKMGEEAFWKWNDENEKVLNGKNNSK